MSSGASFLSAGRGLQTLRDGRTISAIETAFLLLPRSRTCGQAGLSAQILQQCVRAPYAGCTCMLLYLHAGPSFVLKGIPLRRSKVNKNVQNVVLVLRPPSLHPGSDSGISSLAGNRYLVGCGFRQFIRTGTRCGAVATFVTTWAAGSRLFVLRRAAGSLGSSGAHAGENIELPSAGAGRWRAGGLLR